jgi:predicted peroxiredoxin
MRWCDNLPRLPKASICQNENRVFHLPDSSEGETMKNLLSTLSLLAVLSSVGTAIAGANDPLFINMTTDDDHRATMAIGFGVKQHALGHPLTLFLNDKGVQIASKANAGKFADQQKELVEAMAKGATVIACPLCMKHYGVKESDLLPGIKVGKPELTGGALFKDNTKTLTW